MKRQPRDPYRDNLVNRRLGKQRKKQNDQTLEHNFYVFRLHENSPNIYIHLKNTRYTLEPTDTLLFNCAFVRS